ncbi:MAG TPA: autotransporter assembly complex family protein [Noviherbaspirillum sp.]|nr:autotransporter assembly complex family protein [Noviherbaspirillum sp.]
MHAFLRLILPLREGVAGCICYWLSAAIRTGMVCLLFLSSAAHAQTAIQYTVAITGADSFADLLAEHLDINRRQEDAHLSADEIQRLVTATPAQIRELLATEGYFSPEIRTELDQGRTPWVARFDIALGPPTRVTDVQIRFKGAIASGPDADERRMERQRRRWQLDPGEIFRQADWSAAKSALLKRLLVNDFPAAAITYSEARIDPQNNSAALTVEVDSGPAFTFGELDIQGLSRYSRALIDNVNPIRPGQPYSQDKLNELQARLEDTGYFRSAFATVEIDPASPHNVPVRLDLVERQRKRLSLGIGFSTDSGARAQTKWLDRNFLLRNWRLESELRVDRETQLIGGEVFLPPISGGLLPQGWLPSFGAHFERTTTSGETDDKVRTGVRLVSPNRFDEKAWAITFLADRQRIGDTFVNNRQALIGSFTYTKRRLDHPLTPRSGYVASIELGAGPQDFINENSIGRVVSRILWLKPITRDWRAVLRGQVGEVFGASRLIVPADLLFRTGGDQSVRGYGFNTLGVEQNGAVVGGKVTAVLSAELVYRLAPQWGAAIFTDAGNAADSWRDFKFERGSGLGARWRSPIGPVNLDVARSHSTHKWRLHFSVGYGF